MKYSIFMQWKQKQTILIYIILLQFKELFDKQIATFNYYVQTNTVVVSLKDCICNN